MTSRKPRKPTSPRTYRHRLSKLSPSQFYAEVKRTVRKALGVELDEVLA